MSTESRRQIVSTLRQAQEHFRDLPGVEGVGGTEKQIRIYIKDEATKANLPLTFQGMPIKFVISGKIVAHS